MHDYRSTLTFLFFYKNVKILLSLRMLLFYPIQFLKFLVKSQPQCSYKKGSHKEKCI